MSFLRSAALMFAVGLTAFSVSYPFLWLGSRWMRRKTRIEIVAFFSLCLMTLAGIYTLRSEFLIFLSSWTNVLLLVAIRYLWTRAALLAKTKLDPLFRAHRLLYRLQGKLNDGRRRATTEELVLVVYTDYFGRIYADYVVAALIEYGGFSAKSSSMVFVQYDLLRGFSDELKLWVSSEADAMLVVRGIVRGELESELVGGQSLLRPKGKVYLIDVEWRLDGPRWQRVSSSVVPEQPLYVRMDHSIPYLNEVQRQLLEPVWRDLRSCALVMAAEDRRLGERGTTALHLLGAHGFPCLASAYNRFRLSSSDTERLLSLFDCFEVVIRLGASILLKSCEARGLNLAELVFRRAPKAELKKLTLGDWCRLLGEGTRYAGNTDLEKEIVRFWRETPLTSSCIASIDAVSGMGLAAKGAVPRSHQEWLDWLVSLRNETKGHGALGEGISRPVWPHLNEVLLEMIEQMPESLTGLQVLARVDGTIRIVPPGWKALVLSGVVDEGSVATEIIFQSTNGEAVGNMRPLLHYEADTLWFLLDADKSKYLDYGTGKIIRVRKAVDSHRPAEPLD